VSATDKTFRVFLLGAGFSKPAGLPLAGELLPLLEQAASTYMSANGYNHLSDAVGRYEEYLAETDPSRPFDFEEFGAWLDWEHVLRLKGSATFSEFGNEPGLQLRWAIGHVLHAAMPTELPAVYLDFARRLNTSDTVLTLNYDLLMERALEEVGVPYRRFPDRYSEIYEHYNVVDSNQPDELILSKLHGSIDWTYLTGRAGDTQLALGPLVEGPRAEDDPLLRIGVIPRDRLDAYYSTQRSWYENPALIMNPSTAKPMGTSPLIPLWDGLGRYAYMLGGFTVIGCSLPPGDPYVLRLVHHIATDYAAGRERGDALWPQCRMRVVDFRQGRVPVHELRERYRFMTETHTDFFLDGFTSESLEEIFATPEEVEMPNS
jgi:hypothetical protein